MTFSLANFFVVNFFYLPYLPLIGSFILFLAMICYWISLIFLEKKQIFFLARGLVFLSNVLFAMTLFFRWISEGYFPLSNLYESLLFLCWSISTILLFLERKIKSRLIGAILTPILFYLSKFSTMTLPSDMQKAFPLVPSLQSNWLMMHVSLMMLSYATLIVGSLLSIFYIVFEFFLKKKQNSSIQISTNFKELLQVEQKKYLLQIFDTWSYRIIGFGFPLLTIGIISGAVWANEAWGSYWSWDPKETWAFITWLTFAIYLHVRLIKGWQGTKAAFLGSCGFFILWICYLGVNFLGQGLHSYGWVLN